MFQDAGGQRMPLQAASIAEALELLLSSTASARALIGRGWGWMRSLLVVPVVRVAVLLCLVMSVMMLVEKLSMGVISLFVKLARRSPDRVHRWQPLTLVSATDEEMGMENGNHQQQSSFFPMVLVQIPMYNEKEVYQKSIGAACDLEWPSDRIIIQILDDSTDPFIKDLVKTECERWHKMGKSIKYETRNNRHGYKAGALKEGMKHSYVQSCEFVAIFDADFQPSSDFLMRAMPFLIHNPDIGLVQARWRFVNANECLMTRVQEMSMDYHFKVEQESGSSAAAFFGFNGTAGVWRIMALNEAGGWKERTTVEDMDLAVRASLGGWKFLYVGNIQVKSELPSTFKAYRHQQHRWACGPANLFRKMLTDIVHAKKVSFWRKCHVLYNFFIARRIISHCVTFFSYCVVIPLSVFFEEVEVPKWAVFYVPTIITLLNSVGTPSSFHLIVVWVLFENVVSLHRCKAVFIGLLEVGSVNEWVVTEKLGDMLKAEPTVNIRSKVQMKLSDRFHFWELGIGLYLFVCACYDYSYCKDRYFLYIFPQSISFLIMGFGYVGTFVQNG
ncbi:probable glucomannan 4-beta-mannosyltransferase 9 isoform X1 [Dendrobium catenatum]|uniref:glucomannan 4-beta-mannosyltransferase n=2 Tax=Dendrobium TaxID=37818 RepID=A0A0F6NYM4_DENOF|nr:probable glucomannan 4-beta-mannosyltransferase 9 isoform X1 [Dendrobium catenatum]AIW60930.1 mannosyltransferase [Dendrobium officinale]